MLSLGLEALLLGALRQFLESLGLVLTVSWPQTIVCRLDLDV